MVYSVNEMFEEEQDHLDTDDGMQEVDTVTIEAKEDIHLPVAPDLMTVKALSYKLDRASVVQRMQTQLSHSKRPMKRQGVILVRRQTWINMNLKQV